jgi:hypothetical protein
MLRAGVSEKLFVKYAAVYNRAYALPLVFFLLAIPDGLPPHAPRLLEFIEPIPALDTFCETVGAAHAF